ncbi:hypothetical protein BC937DRAFT_86948 [Endogone sp. FLAS-F59071]|nr:hypothetical protein BC937DRAFT_86948 [Endogone sp. FLAS-F59071]|eukprot:RUS19768.1 hypothetical protein BC937DRAFT_86948 [Endogone sp. FLAS-F59071]
MLQTLMCLSRTMSPTASPLRSQVISLYKQVRHESIAVECVVFLIYLGREYPLGYANYFRPHLKSAFIKQRGLEGEEEIKSAIARGEYVVKVPDDESPLRNQMTLKSR